MTAAHHPYGPWHPWHPDHIAQFLVNLDIAWWVAGGWAIDLYLGRQTRSHEDSDVLFLRRDQERLRLRFDTWDLQAAHPDHVPVAWPFRAWAPGTRVAPDVHDVWCRPTPADPWAIQLMIADATGDDWLFRRDTRIQRSLATIGLRTSSGIPYLAPEIQLLYKAKGCRPKDEADFAAILPHLSPDRRQWLAQSLMLVHPGHAWLGALAQA